MCGGIGPGVGLAEGLRHPHCMCFHVLRRVCLCVRGRESDSLVPTYKSSGRRPGSNSC